VVLIGFRERQGRRWEEHAERRVPCELCRGHAPGIDQAAYVTLCVLAETLTFVDLSGESHSVDELHDEIAQVLLTAAATPDRQASLGRLGGHWLDSGRRTTNGVVLAGTVRKLSRRGDFHLAELVLFGMPKVVTVASLASPPLAERDRVLVAGSIVEHPARHVPGYDGNLPLFVWGGYPLKLPGERR
jgi:hypothetical protein